MHVFFIWKSIIVLDVKCYAADSKYNMCLILGIFNFLKETAGDGGDYYGGDVFDVRHNLRARFSSVPKMLQRQYTARQGWA